MTIQEKEELIKSLLGSLRYSPPGGEWKFLWNPYHPYLFSGGYRFKFYIDFKTHTVASIKTIKCYPDLLNGCSISAVSSLLQNYFESVIADIDVNELYFPTDRDKTVLDFTHHSKFMSLINKLDRFITENVKPSIYLMPLNGFPCPKEIISQSILWVQGDCDLGKILNRYGFQHPSITFLKNAINDNFIRPYRLTNNDSWFICQASNEVESESIFKRMVGALSVILKYPESRSIAGREMIRGRAKLSYDGSFTFFNKPCLAPAVVESIEISEDMIDTFNALLIAKSGNYCVQVALECLSDAWGNTPRLSFINNSIAMDALFGTDGQVKKSILKGVDKYAVSVPDAKKI